MAANIIDLQNHSTRVPGDNHIDIILVNLQDGDSIKAAVKAGGRQAEDQIDALQRNPKEMARTAVNGRVIVISVDRIDMHERKNKASRAQRRKFHQEIGAHEGGHALGLCHDRKCRKKEERLKNEQMNNETTLASDMLRWWNDSDIETAAKAAGRF